MIKLIKAILTVSILGLSFGSYAGFFKPNKPKVDKYECTLRIIKLKPNEVGEMKFVMDVEKDGVTTLSFGEIGKSLGLPKGHEYVKVLASNVSGRNWLFNIKHTPLITVESGSFYKEGPYVKNKRKVLMTAKFNKQINKANRIKITDKNATNWIGKRENLKLMHYGLECKKQ